MNALTNEQREILSKLVTLNDEIEGVKATLWQLEHERAKLRSELLQTGYRALVQGDLL